MYMNESSTLEKPVFKMPDPNTFRFYCTEMFYKNKEERFLWKQTPLSAKEYFHINKWFLKRSFKETQNGNP